MKLLDAVNLILPKLGEHQVTSLDTRHPTLAIILPEIQNELTKLLLRGWWFNEFDYTAYPDAEGHIAVGADILTFTPETSMQAVQRGLELYNPDTLSYVFTSAVKGRVRTLLDFDVLPEAAAQIVLYAALVNIFITDIGMAQEVQVWSASGAQAYSDLLSEHCRQKKFTTKSTRQWGNFIRALRG